MKKSLLILFFIVMNLFMYGQKTMDAYFYILPQKKTFVRIDNNQVINLDTIALPYVAKLDTGQHLIEIWNVGYKLYSKNIQIDTGKINRFSIGLKEETPILQAHRREMRKYYTKQSYKYWAGLSIGLLNIWHTQNSVTSVLKEQTRLDQVAEDIRTAKSNYDNSIGASDIRQYKTEYEELVADYEQSQSGYNWFIGSKVLIHTGAYLASAGAIYYVFKVKVKKPVLPTGSNPFYTDTSLKISPNQIGLTLNF